MRKRIYKIILTVIVLICALSICKKDAYAALSQSEIDNLESQGYQYFNTKEEAYAAAKAYATSRPFPEYDGQFNMGGIKIVYPGEAYEAIEQLGENSDKICRTLRETAINVYVRKIEFDSFYEGHTIYYINTTFRSANAYVENLAEDEYNQGEAKAKELASQFNYGTDYEKALRAYNYITSTISYDYSRSTGSIYSGLIENNTVCLGFAESFQAICENMGLEVYTALVPNHAYNIIKLDGQYYVADCTGDDKASEGTYRYCFIGTQDFTDWSYTAHHNQTYGLSIAAQSYNPSILYGGSSLSGSSGSSQTSQGQQTGSNNETSEPTVVSETIPTENTENTQIESVTDITEKTAESAPATASIEIKTNENGEKTVTLNAETKPQKSIIPLLITFAIVFLILCVIISIAIILKKNGKLKSESMNTESKKDSDL